MHKNTMKKSYLNIAAALFLILQLLSISAVAQIMWPSDQILPSFPATAQTQDLFYLSNSPKELRYLFSSLKGIVNMTKPRMFVYDGDAAAEGPYTWLQSLGLNWVEYSDNWQLITKYRSEIEGLIVYDPAQPHTVNLATMLAHDKKALIASPTLLAKLSAAPYNLPVLLDLRNQFTSKLDVYQTLFDTYWPNIDHRLLIGLSPEYHQGSLREYATALGTAVIWLDPEIASERTLLKSFLGSMPAGSNYLGWWPAEGPGVEITSNYGITTIASDYVANLTVHSGMPRTINSKPIPPKPALQNKIYVAFIISDGDNLQYVEHLMRKFWNNPDRGSVPIGWTISPAMVDAMPGALNYYYQTSTSNDNLISGPSGYGYTYPNHWPSQTALNNFVTKTEEYNRRAGIRVTTIWNGSELAIDQDVGETYAAYAPTLLGVTGQNTGGQLTIYNKNNQSLPGKAMTCNYCENEAWMKTFISEGSAGWNGDEPRFLIVQANPWQGVTPTSFKNVMTSLNSDYIVVRPDHIFELIREANGLPINPSSIYGNGDGLTGDYYNGMNFETLVASRRDHTIDFDWGADAPLTGVNPDNFSVKWTGQIQPIFAEDYTFYVTSDDGVKLTIDGNLLIDSFTEEGLTTKTATLTLKAGRKYDITLEYAEATQNASCHLEWQSSSQAREIVPKIQLYPEAISLSPTTGLVTAYVDSGFNGFSTALEVGEYTLEDLKNIGIFDKDIASLKVSKGYKVMLYTQDNFEGYPVEVTEDKSDLEGITSLKVKTNGATDLSGTYILQNRASNYYMDVSGGTSATGNGSNIIQYSLTSKTNQQFKFIPLGDGAYEILAAHSNKSIDIGGRSQDDGANANQWDYLGLPNQKFILIPAEDGYYKIMAQHSGKILEAENTSIEGNIRQMTDSDEARGQWKLLSTPEGKIGAGTGLTADYYNGQNFETLKYTTIDATIDFSWNDGSPNNGVNQDNFSVRWTGAIQPKFTSYYTFYINSDNGRRLWVNDELIIDKWIDDYGVEYSGGIQLTEGQVYDIKLEYFESVGGASCKLEWESDFHSKEVVPTSQLYPDEALGVTNYKKDKIYFFPIPTKNKLLNIRIPDLPENEKVLFKIYDISGKLVLQTQVQKSDRIDLNKLQSGIYFVKVSTKFFNINRKIIVQ